MSKDNQKYVKTLAKVCRKKKYVTALKSMSTTSKSMSQHTEYVKSSPIFLMWASGLFCMAVVQLWCTCVLLLGLHPCVMLRGQRIRCGGSARTQWWAMLNRMQHDATACNQMQPATPGGTCDRRAVQVRCAWTFLTARRCVTACERVRCSNASADSRKPSSSSAGYSRP